MRHAWLIVILALLPLSGATCDGTLIDNTDRDSRPSQNLALAISRPGSDRVVPQGTPVEVEWTASNRSGTTALVTIVVESRTDLSRTTLVDAEPISGLTASRAVEWDTTGFDSGAYLIIGTIEAGIEQRRTTASGEITINQPPTFAFTAPVDNATLTRGETVTIRWTAQDPDGDGSARIGVDSDNDHGSGNEIFLTTVELPEESDSDSFEWNGEDDGEEVALGAYNVFALVTDELSAIETVEGLGTITIVEPEEPEEPITLGIREPISDVEFPSGAAPLKIEFGINAPEDRLIDLKLDADDNHQNGNEITILAQRLVEADTETDTFDWDGNDSNGMPLPNGIYRLLLLSSDGSSTPQREESEGFVFRRSSLTSAASRQTWDRADASWSLIDPETEPSARRELGLAFDTAREVTVLFGGTDGTAENAETWLFDRVTWTQQMVSGPPAVHGHALAFDDNRGVTVLFGGRSAGAAINQTWEWDGTAWTQRTPATSPTARRGHALAYDSTRDVVVLFGGVDDVGLRNAETWEWNGTDWTQKTPATSPGARFSHAMCFDSDRNKIVLFGGDTDVEIDAQTWEYDGTTWTLLAPTTRPGSRSGHAMIYDTARDQTVLFGGTNGVAANGESWRWDGTAWTQADLNPSPAARTFFGLTFDSESNKTVLFGGETGLPLIALQAPATAQTVNPGDFVQLRWRDDDPTGIATIRITLDDDRNPDEGAETGAAEVQLLTGRDATPDGLQDSFSFQVPGTLTLGETYYVFAYVDRSGTSPFDHVSIAPAAIIVRDPANP